MQCVERAKSIPWAGGIRLSSTACAKNRCVTLNGLHSEAYVDQANKIESKQEGSHFPVAGKGGSDC
jgi:hypothetical protein